MLKSEQILTVESAHLLGGHNSGHKCLGGWGQALYGQEAGTPAAALQGLAGPAVLAALVGSPRVFGRASSAWWEAVPGPPLLQTQTHGFSTAPLGKGAGPCDCLLPPVEGREHCARPLQGKVCGQVGEKQSPEAGVALHGPPAPGGATA